MLSAGICPFHYCWWNAVSRNKGPFIIGGSTIRGLLLKQMASWRHYICTRPEASPDFTCNKFMLPNDSHVRAAVGSDAGRLMQTEQCCTTCMQSNVAPHSGMANVAPHASRAMFHHMHAGQCCTACRQGGSHACRADYMHAGRMLHHMQTGRMLHHMQTGQCYSTCMQGECCTTCWQGGSHACRAGYIHSGRMLHHMQAGCMFLHADATVIVFTDIVIVFTISLPCNWLHC